MSSIFDNVPNKGLFFISSLLGIMLMNVVRSKLQFIVKLNLIIYVLVLLGGLTLMDVQLRELEEKT